VFVQFHLTGSDQSVCRFGRNQWCGATGFIRQTPERTRIGFSNQKMPYPAKQDDLKLPGTFSLREPDMTTKISLNIQNICTKTTVNEIPYKNRIFDGCM